MLCSRVGKSDPCERASKGIPALRALVGCWLLELIPNQHLKDLRFELSGLGLKVSGLCFVAFVLPGHGPCTTASAREVRSPEGAGLVEGKPELMETAVAPIRREVWGP